jgi:hypothetical protein
MITFAGFSALLLAVRPAAGARLSLLDRYLAKTVMTYIFVLTAGALLPALFALYDIQEKWIWRGSGVLFALPMLSLQVTYPRRRRKVVGKGPPPAIFAVFVVFGSAVTLAMLGYVLGGPPIQRRSLHHGVDDRLLYGHFRLRGRARCHYATTQWKCRSGRRRESQRRNRWGTASVRQGPPLWRSCWWSIQAGTNR